MRPVVSTPFGESPRNKWQEYMRMLGKGRFEVSIDLIAVWKWWKNKRKSGSRAETRRRRERMKCHVVDRNSFKADTNDHKAGEHRGKSV